MLSPWESSVFHARPQLVVVGAGLVGLFTALHYRRSHPGHRVLVLERGPHPSGASVKNAGFACFGSPSELLADIAREGETAALARVEERWRGLQKLRNELGDEAIGYEPTGGHEHFIANSPLYKDVAQGFDRLNDLLRPVVGGTTYHWDNGTVARMGLAPDLLTAVNPHEGALHSGLLMRTLWRKVVEAGILIRTSADVVAIEDRTGGVELRLADGTRLPADRLVVATNGFTAPLLPELGIVPARGQVLLTEPVPGLRLHGTHHMEEGFYYFREFEGAVLLGGGRHLDLAGEQTVAEGLNDRIQQALEVLLREVILPGTEYRIRQRWSGIMGFREKGKEPYVGHVSKHVVAAVGLSGMGVAIGIRVAKKAADLLDL